MQIQTLRIIVAMLLTLVAMLYFYTNREKDYYSKSAEPAVAQILTEISSWEKQTLLTHLAPETKQTINDEQLEKLLNLYRTFVDSDQSGSLIFHALSVHFHSR